VNLPSKGYFEPRLVASAERGKNFSNPMATASRVDAIWHSMSYPPIQPRLSAKTSPFARAPIFRLELLYFLARHRIAFPGGGHNGHDRGIRRSLVLGITAAHRLVAETLGTHDDHPRRSDLLGGTPAAYRSPSSLIYRYRFAQEIIYIAISR
jgi:hypothetical protein